VKRKISNPRRRESNPRTPIVQAINILKYEISDIFKIRFL